MNQLYEVIKPVRVKPLEEGNFIERWSNFSPGGLVATVSMGYIALLGLFIGICLKTVPLY